jgi:hypothetical protein
MIETVRIPLEHEREDDGIYHREYVDQIKRLRCRVDLEIVPSSVNPYLFPSGRLLDRHSVFLRPTSQAIREFPAIFLIL